MRHDFIEMRNAFYQANQLRKGAFLANGFFSAFVAGVFIFLQLLPMTQKTDGTTVCLCLPPPFNPVKIKLPPIADNRFIKKVGMFFLPPKPVYDTLIEDDFSSIELGNDDKTTRCLDKDAPIVWNERWLSGEFSVLDSVLTESKKTNCSSPPYAIEQMSKNDETHCFSAPSFKKPEFPGGLHAFTLYLASKITRPDDVPLLSGRVLVGFVVGQDGIVKNITIVKSLSPDYDAAVLKVIATLPRFLPARNVFGKPIEYNYELPVDFSIEE